MRMEVYAHGCIRCSISTRIGIRTELFENDRPMILGWIVTRVVRLRAVLGRVRLGSLHFVRIETATWRAGFCEIPKFPFKQFRPPAALMMQSRSG